MRQVFIACFCLQVILFLVLPLPVDATVPQGFTDTQVGSNLASPTAMAFAPDGRIFVCQQTGQLRVIENGTLLSANFLSLTVDSSGERGLLGIAFDPNFTSNQYVYVYYTVPGNPPHNRVSRFTANGNIAVTGSELIILELDNLTGATNHNGGALHFGLDGKLYVAVGDNATSSNSQTLGNLHGKMLRINTDGTVPNDNPFYGQASGKNRAIWSLGLRNPFTFAVDPDGGEMFINDVGQVTREEINRGIAGANYGWPTCEGPCNPTNANFTDPIYYYTHATSNTQGCAITGGTFYNPSVQQFPTTYVGKYFFADFCNNWINYLDADGPPSANTATVFATALSSPVDLQVGTDGCLYYLQRGAGGQVRKIQYTGSASPVITSHPASLTVSVAQTATFTVQASGAEPLSYQWQRNNVNIAGATAASYTTPATVIGDSGATYRCVVTNSADSATSNNAMLTVTTNLPPIPTISNPTAGTFYTAGQTLNYSGTATDPETGALSASALTWQVDFYHGTHVHPFMPATSGITSGSFTIPAAGETAADVFYRITLTATDTVGLRTTTFRDVLPRTADITLTTSPSGLEVLLDGQPFTAPNTFTGVAGATRTISVRSPQIIGSIGYSFNSWSDGEARTHSISTPSVNTTYTVSFTATSTTIDTDNDGMPDVVEGGEGTNPNVKDNDIFTNNRWFAMQQYRDFLAREGEEAGVSYWASLPGSGVTRAQEIEGFYNSAEFQNIVPPIIRLYTGILNRYPDYAGLQTHINFLRAGGSLITVAQSFADSPEFQSLYGSSLTNEQFVSVLYQNVLNRTPAPSEVDYWVQVLQGGATRGQVMTGFTESVEFRTSSSNEIFVLSIYFSMFRRTPSSAEVNPRLDQLVNGASRTSVIQGLMDLPEYHNRFLP